MIKIDNVVYSDPVAEGAVDALNNGEISTPEEFFEAADGDNKTDPDYIPVGIQRPFFQS